MGIGIGLIVALAIWYFIFQIAESNGRAKRQKKFIKNMNEYDKKDDGTR